MPFDAMKGLQEALRDREERHSRVERRELSEEETERLSRSLAKLCRGMKVAVNCYYAFHDVVKEGTVTAVDTIFRYIRLNDEKIFFDDIYSIEVIDIR